MTGAALAAGLVAAAVGGWFLYSGIAKARRRSSTERSVAQYAIVPTGFARIVVLWLIGGEVLVGGLLLLGAIPVISLVAAAILLTTFAAGVAVDLALGRHHSCGCGSGEQDITWRLAARNVAMAVALIWSATQANPVPTVWTVLTVGLVMLLAVVVLQAKATIGLLRSVRAT